MGVEISIKNDNTLEVIRRKNEAIARALEIIGGKAMGFAAGYAPTDTGRLKSSIVYATSRNQMSGTSPAKTGDYAPRATPEQGAVYIGTNVEYASYQEFGTSKTEAANGGNGYIRPAIQNHLNDYKDIFKQELDNA